MCLSQKYELFHLANKKTECETTINEIFKIIEANEMNGLKPKYINLISGGTSHERFIEFYSEHINNILTVGKNCGIDEEIFKNKLSNKGLEFAERDLEWTIKSFFEFSFPTVIN